jgi:hypothetical protein
MGYKRYMIFEWSDYDNPSPFDCVVASFDDVQEARNYIEDFISHPLNILIFDRIEGKSV